MKNKELVEYFQRFDSYEITYEYGYAKKKPFRLTGIKVEAAGEEVFISEKRRFTRISGQFLISFLDCRTIRVYPCYSAEVNAGRGWKQVRPKPEREVTYGPFNHRIFDEYRGITLEERLEFERLEREEKARIAAEKAAKAAAEKAAKEAEAAEEKKAKEEGRHAEWLQERAKAKKAERRNK